MVRVLRHEKPPCGYRQQVDHVQQRTDQQHRHHRPLASIRRARQQIPLAPRATQRREPDDAERADQERAEGERHHPAQPVQLADFSLVGRGVDRAGAEEQGDLAHGVHHDLHRTADHTHRGGQRRAQHHVAQLADRGIGEPGLEIVLGQGHEGGQQYGQRRHPQQPLRGAGGAQEINAEHVNDHLHHREHTGLNHRHGMKQRADRSRRDHRRRQPAMERHQRRLADAEHVQRQQDSHGRAFHLAGQNAARHEIQGPGDCPGPDDGQQQQTDGGAQQDAQIQPSGPHGLGRALVGDQRVGREGQRFVEDEQGQQIAGEGNADGAGDGDGETDVEPGLVLFLVAAHVADGIERIQRPQQRCHAGEGHAQRFHAQPQRQAGCELEQIHGGPGAGQHRRQQGQHDAEQQHRSQQGRTLAPVGAVVVGGDEKRAQQRDEQRQ